MSASVFFILKQSKKITMKNVFRFASNFLDIGYFYNDFYKNTKPIDRVGFR